MARAAADRYLAGEAGIRQIIDIGTGIPAAGNVHEVAAQAAPGTQVAYVDNDPIVHVHASALLTGSGTTSIVLADLREPEAILAHPKVRALIDFTQPVALLIAILQLSARTTTIIRPNERRFPPRPPVHAPAGGSDAGASRGAALKPKLPESPCSWVQR